MVQDTFNQVFKDQIFSKPFFWFDLEVVHFLWENNYGRIPSPLASRSSDRQNQHQQPTNNKDEINKWKPGINKMKIGHLDKTGD